ncbi:MAG TPA: ImmA/IrrE family metallo-endopeptidase [Streptosporangiaceae bacterium]|nr:ImmA/IrrE family metallo-endopeptidase [Streptosporangiaceae bacterium]
MGTLASYVADELDIDVAIEPLSPGLDGLAASRPGFQLIMVSSSVSATRQRYTLAHELGHLLAGDGSRKSSLGIQVDENIMGARSPAETRANAFAAAFLMPAEALRAACGGQAEISQQLIADLLGRYRVSLDALAFRLHDTGIITAAQREEIRRMSSARIAMRHGRTADLQARRGRRWPDGLLSRALEAYARAEISIRPIAQLLEVDEAMLLEELAPIQLGPPDRSADDELVPFL